MITETKPTVINQNQLRNILQQYSVQQLSRCLIRQFLIQNKLAKTLQTFQLEDHKHKKINKSTLIRILSMNNLVYYNKQLANPLKSLLEVLVNYLKNKFKDKIENRNNQGKSNSKLESSRNQMRKDDISIAPSINMKPQQVYNQHTDQNYEDDYENEWQHDEQKNNTKLMHSVQQEIIKPQKQENLFKTTQLPQTSSITKKIQPEPKQKISEKLNCINISQEQNIQQQKFQPKQTLDDKPQSTLQKTQGKNSPNQKQALKTQIPYKPTRPQSAAVTNISKNEEKGSGSRMMGMKRFGRKKQQATQLKIQTNKPQQHKQQQIDNKKQQKQVQQQSKQQNLISKQKNNQKQYQSKQIPKQQQGPKMVKMFGKKKKKQDENSQPTKFKFDDNFVDKPLNADVQKYEYKPMDMYKITIQNQQTSYQIDYRSKPKLKKSGEKQKPITQKQATTLKKAIFQNGLSSLPKSWNQGFILSPFKQTPYGLQQIEGGPCGIIAAVQCYYLKHYLHLSKLSKQQQNIELIRDNCLMASIADMLYKVRNQQNKVILTLPPKGFAGNKIDFTSLKIFTLDATKFQSFYQSFSQYRNYFVGKTNHGVTVLMICMIMTKGLEKIKQQIDMPDSPLIGNHGHCTQELVNLFITGIASSNCFDGDKFIDDDMKIKGIPNKGQFGFLTIFQTLKYLQVGKNLKNPVYPFWIICKEFHYHVIFADHYLIAENNQAQKFDIAYFDGLYNCADRIIITLQKYAFGQEPTKKDKQLPLIQQVMMTKWGQRKSNWNGSTPIL